MGEKIPEYIGKYKIMGLIAKGGMGAVYKAVHQIYAYLAQIFHAYHSESEKSDRQDEIDPCS